MIKSATKPATLLAPIMAMALVLAGCSGIDRATGRTKQSPDEFEVVVRPPLSLPPGFSLRPVPEDAGARNTATGTTTGSATDAAGRTLGTREAASRGFDAVFGTDRAEQGIRETLDTETLGVTRERGLSPRALFGGKPPAAGPQLSAEDEARRILELERKGQSPTATPTRARDPETSDNLTVE